ncbi:MAG: hypothetical protein WDW38_007913 [Sanguina aurantia]
MDSLAVQEEDSRGNKSRGGSSAAPGPNLLPYMHKQLPQLLASRSGSHTLRPTPAVVPCHVKYISPDPPTAIVTFQLNVTGKQEQQQRQRQQRQQRQQEQQQQQRQQHVAAVALQCVWGGLQQRRMIAQQIKADAVNR